MTTSILFSTYLHDVMRERRMTSDELSYELDHPTRSAVETWLHGWERPNPADLPKLALILRVDAVDLAVGWLADIVPELETVLFEQVLNPRGSKFPNSGDLALRAPTPRASKAVECMDVGDPHDREPIRRKAIPDGGFRKRSPASRAS